MPVRTAAVSLAAALVAVLALAPASQARARQPNALLRQAERAFESRPAGVKRDLTPLLKQLAAELPRLHGAARRRAVRLLARPSDGAADPDQNGWSVPEALRSPLCTTHYCVHWVTIGSDAPPPTDGNANGLPDWVETVAAVAENAHAVENEQLGWRTPKSDGTRGGGTGKTDVYLSDIGGSGIYGYTSADSGEDIRSHSVSSYVVVDNDFSRAQFPQYSSPQTPLEVTVAHEYNHVLHYTYDALEDTWMFESTAVWMEGRVYPAAFDYLQYLPGWVRLPGQPITTFNGRNPNDRRNLKVYGSAVWNKWLDARYGPQVVRRAWEDSRGTNPDSFAPAAFNAAIRQFGGRGFSDEFDRFAAATAEWQARNSGFPEGARYPDVSRRGSMGLNGGRRVLRLNHTAFALIALPSSSARRVKLRMTAPRGTASAFALVRRTGGRPGGTATRTIKVLPHGGTATIAIAAGSSFRRMTAVLVNSDYHQRGYSASRDDWLFTKDRQRFVVTAR
jgi:hypothetical protein